MPLDDTSAARSRSDGSDQSLERRQLPAARAIDVRAFGESARGRVGADLDDAGGRRSSARDREEEPPVIHARAAAPARTIDAQLHVVGGQQERRAPRRRPRIARGEAVSRGGAYAGAVASRGVHSGKPARRACAGAVDLSGVPRCSIRPASLMMCERKGRTPLMVLRTRWRVKPSRRPQIVELGRACVRKSASFRHGSSSSTTSKSSVMAAPARPLLLAARVGRERSAKEARSNRDKAASTAAGLIARRCAHAEPEGTFRTRSCARSVGLEHLDSRVLRRQMWQEPASNNAVPSGRSAAAQRLRGRDRAQGGRLAAPGGSQEA